MHCAAALFKCGFWDTPLSTGEFYDLFFEFSKDEEYQPWLSADDMFTAIEKKYGQETWGHKHEKYCDVKIGQYIWARCKERNRELESERQQKEIAELR